MALMDLSLTPGLHPAISPALASIDFGRARLAGSLKNLSAEQLSQTPPGLPNSIATLVVHVACTEVVAAYRLTGENLPEDLAREFLRDQLQSPLPIAQGETVDSLTAKLAKSRAILADALAPLTEADLPRELVYNPDRSVTVRWLLNLLPGHQMLHHGHIQMIRRLI